MSERMEVIFGKADQRVKDGKPFVESILNTAARNHEDREDMAFQSTNQQEIINKITPAKHEEDHYSVAKHKERDSVVDIENQLNMLRTNTGRELTFTS